MSLFIQIFQRAKQVVGAVIFKQAAVFSVIQQAVLRGKGIVGSIQLLLCFLDIFFRVVVQLPVNQFVDNLPQFYHADHSVFGIAGQLHLRHDRVFAVINLSFHHGITEVLHIGVCRQGSTLRFRLCNVRRLRSSFQIPSLQLLHSLTELVCQICTFYQDDRSFFFAILCAFGGQFTQNHLRVVRKVAVDGDAICRLSQLHPCGFMVHGPVAFLQKDDVTDNIGARIGAECIVWQSDCSQQIRTLRNMLPGSRILTVQRITAGNKRHHAARTHLVDGFGEKVVVDRKSQLVVRLVVDFIIAKWHIAHGKVIEIAAVSGFKSGNFYASFRVELLRNATCNAVQFYTVQAAVCHAVRQQAKKITNAHGGFQYIAAAEAHALYRIIDNPPLVSPQHPPTADQNFRCERHSFLLT